MILDNLDDLNLPVKTKFTWFQKIALGIEIALAIIGVIGISFKLQSLPRGSELTIISFTLLTLIYTLLSVSIFRSKKTWEHMFSLIAGLILSFCVMGALYNIENWPNANEMHVSAIVASMGIIALLIVLFAKNFKDKRNLYLRIGLRYLIIWLILIF